MRYAGHDERMVPVTSAVSEDDKRQVRAIVRKSGSSFYWAMRLLPRKRREAMFALYALARELDDIADEPGEPTAKLSKLEAWKKEIDALYAGIPNSPISRALLPAIQYFKLNKREFLELIAGMETDVKGPVIAPSEEDLHLYCRRVAGTIGLLSLAIFGRDEEEAKTFSLALADALQLTNILRDLTEDAAMGRLYLPKELLKRHGVSGATPEAIIRHENLHRVCEELVGQAEEHFRDAREALKKVGAEHLRPAIIMMAVYHEILQRLKRRGWRQLTPKLSLSGSAKAWIAFRHLLTVQP